MKKIKYFCLLLLLIISISSCEKQIEVDLDTAPPRLVVDASIKWIKGTTGNEQKIKLTTTTGYFDNLIPTVSGATIFITDANNSVFNFTETTGNGEYFCTNFIPLLNSDYKLTIIYNNEIFTATETLKPVPAIDKIEQKNNSGFSGNDIQIKAFFTDDGAKNDFYLFQFRPSDRAISNFEVLEDKFFQGNQIFGIYEDENLKPGQTLDISINGISERYYNYMNILISIAGGGNGSPFQSPPATVRGNLINNTNENNYVLGYFQLSEVDYKSFLVQ